MSTNSETACMNGQCHCGTVQFSVCVPPQVDNDPELEHTEEGFRALTSPVRGSEPPRKAWAMSYCYCDDCRASSGALFQPFICVPKAFLKVGQTAQNIDDAVASGTLGVYESTPGRSTRIFCRKCSTPLFFLFASFPRVVEVAPMALEKTAFAQHVELIGHYNVKDTPNGQGGLVKLAEWIEDNVERKSGGMRSKGVDFSTAPANVPTPTLDQLVGGCHCGAVKYRVAAPKGYKFIAGACHCDDCRLWTSGMFWSWIPVSRSSLTLLSPESTLVTYKSSEFGRRQHCAHCFTSMFWFGLEAFDEGRIEFSTATLDKNHALAYVEEGVHSWMSSTGAGGKLLQMDAYKPGTLRRKPHGSADSDTHLV